ncbi:MAG: tyrosine-type recombinase/integrase [Paracoccaceae bacterium]
MPKLTAKTVKALKEPGRYGDGGGLYLYVGKDGTRSWVLRVTVRGRRTDIGLGAVAWVSLAEAREKAAAMRKAAREGRDPVAERKQAAGVPTFEEAARRVHEQLKPGWRAGGVHVTQWLSSLEIDVFPKIGARRINTITSADDLDVLSPIWFAKPETARRVRQRIRQVMQWAKGANLYDGENPVDRAAGSLPRHQSAQKRHHAAMPYAELPAFMSALGERDGIAARALAFAILTAARSGEVRGMTWSEIDVAAATWTIPAERMKAKAEHRVPLPAKAVALVRSMEGLDPVLVFPGAKRGKPMSDMTLAAVLKRMGLDGCTVHGFRSTFRDWTGERTTVPREIAELALAHAVGSDVERAYARSDLFEKRRDLMERWAGFACGAGADVVRIAG